MKKKNYNVCMKCLKVLTVDNSYCTNCEEGDLITYQNNKVIYKGRAYHQKKWMARLSVFDVENGSLKMKYFHKPLAPQYVLEMYKKNIKYATIIAIVLPVIIFVLSSIGAFTTASILGNQSVYKNTSIFLIFIGIVFLFFAVCVLVLFVIKKHYCVITINNSAQIQYRKVPKTIIIDKMKQLKKLNQKEEVII